MLFMRHYGVLVDRNTLSYRFPDFKIVSCEISLSFALVLLQHLRTRTIVKVRGATVRIMGFIILAILLPSEVGI